LLSFAEEEKLTETSEGSKNRKLKSAHDLEASSQLSQAVLDQRPSLNQLNLPENFKSTLPETIPDNPLKVHEALRAVVGRERSGPSESGKTKTKESPVDDSFNKKGKGKHEKKSKESNTELSAA
jgi:hypothetical protein